MSIAKRTRSNDGGSGEKHRKVMIFERLGFLLLPKQTNSTVMKKRKSVYESHGAQVESALNSKVTHVLVPEGWDLHKIGRHLDLDKLGKRELLRDEWLAKCIDSNKLVDPKPYRVDRDEHSKTDSHPPKEAKEAKEEVNGHEENKQEEQDGLEDAIELNKIEADASGILSDGEYDSEEESKLKGDWKGYLANKNNSKDNPNHRTIAIFTLMMNHYDNIGERFRKLAYRRAISTLENCDKPITTADQAKQLSGIGDSLAEKLEEISETGHLAKLENAKTSEMGDTMALFKRIHGVGSKTAHAWFQEGLRTLDDVKNRSDLTQSQRIGLEHIDEFNEPIPRDVVLKHANVVIDELKKQDSDVIPYVMGSYRRGLPQSGDIDLILTKKGATLDELKPIQEQLIDTLMSKGFIKCQLSGNSKSTTRFLGACQLEEDSGKWRRIDTLLVPWHELGASLIYYTGNDLFNRSIRLLAIRKGMHLSQHGLYRLPSSRTEPTSGDIIESHDEKKIFQHLGVTYRDPTQRNVG